MSSDDLLRMREELCLSVADHLVNQKSDRIILVTYDPAFRDWTQILKLRMTEQYQVILLDNLMSESITSVNNNSMSLGQNITQKLLFAGLGFIPVIGSWIGLAQTVADIAYTTYGYQIKKSDLKLLRDHLGIHPHRKKRRRKPKQIVYIPDYGALSDKKRQYLQLLSYLIKSGYLSATALIIGCGSNELRPDLIDWEKRVSLELDMLHTWFGNDIQIDSIREILNLVGIGRLEDLKRILSAKQINEDIMLSLLNTLLDRTLTAGTVDRSEFHHFLHLCSMLFEPFMQEDIERNYLSRELSADTLVEYALESRLLQRLNASPIYCFIEYFIRDFYRNHAPYTLPMESYRSLFSYLKSKYPYQYTDIALLSVHIGVPPIQAQSYAIIAWYHEHDTLSQRKKDDLKEKMKLGTLWMSYINLYDIYSNLSTKHDAQCISAYENALDLIENSALSPEAICCYLNTIAAIAFEFGACITFFTRILDNYFLAFSNLELFSKPAAQYVEYMVDALILSVGLELPLKYRDALDRLSMKIEPSENLPELKRLRLFRLGNVIFSPAKGHIYTRMAYEQSIDYPYEHILSAINYSASLLCRAQFSQAERILARTADSTKIYKISSNMAFSFENNWIIAQAMSGKIKKFSVRRQFEHLYEKLSYTSFSDSVIVRNNFAAAMIFSAPKTYYIQAKKILEQISGDQDDYHRFFAVHNMLILFCLVGNKQEFFQWKATLEVPYLLRWYKDFFSAKFDAIENCFDRCETIPQIEHILNPLKEQFSELDLRFYQFPVLWGVIERWFE